VQFLLARLFQKQSWLYVSDNTNVRWIKIFHLYKGFFRKKTFPSYFVKSSARVVEPPRIVYKGFKYKYKIKGDICRAFIIRSMYNKQSKSFFKIWFKDSSCILIKKKFNTSSKHLFGPIPKLIRRKKTLTLFKKIL